MAAPLGNQFWKLRSKHGRDKLFSTPQDMWEAACEYFQWCEDNPLMEAQQGRGAKPVKNSEGELVLAPDIIELPKMRAFTLQGLCRYLDCNTVYFNEFAIGLKGKEDEMSKDFSKILTRIRETIYEQKFTGAAAGFLNPNIIARDLGLAEKNEHTGKDGAPIPIHNSGQITHTVNFQDASDSGTDKPEPEEGV
jgi:hypothetical protein